VEFLRYRAQRSAEEQLDAEVESLNRLLEDQAYQLSLMPEAIVSQAQRNGQVDEIVGAQGRFAYVPTNPVPVNGTVGAMAWLSRLQTRHKESLVFHRLGQIGAIEVYEAMSLIRRQWFVFFTDPRYAGASDRAPEGLNLMEPGRPFHGVGSLMRDFPHEFADIVQAYSEEFRLATLAPNKVLNQLSDAVVERPLAQQLKLEWVAHAVRSGSAVSEREPALV